MLGIVWESDAEKSCDEAEDRWARATDVIDLIGWTLSRDPNAGTALTEGGTLLVFAVHGAKSIDLPTAVVTYSFDQEYVFVIDVTFSDATAWRAGNA